jgi:hypothetical protein
MHTEEALSRLDLRRWPTSSARHEYAYLVVGLLKPGEERHACDVCGMALGPYDSASLVVTPREPHLDEPFETYYFSSIRGLELYGPVPEDRRLELWRKLEVHL